MKFFNLIVLLGFCWSCASVQSPQGGPKDDTPPKLLAASPVNASTNFRGRALNFEFNEDVKEENPKKLFISPIVPYTVSTSNKRFKIIPDSVLNENTTYTLNFQKKIKDDKEGNFFKDTTLQFSTGNSIDSIELSLKVQNISNKPLNQNILAQIKDKQKRTFIGKSEKSNNLRIPGISSGKYYLEVFTDINENYKYDEDDGFLYFDSIQIDTSATITIKPTFHKNKEIKLFKQVRNDTLSIESNKPFLLSGEINDKIVYSAEDKKMYRIYPFTKRWEIEYYDTIGNFLLDTIDKVKIDSSRSMDFIQTIKRVNYKLQNKSIVTTLIFNWNIDTKPKQFEINQDSVWKKVEPVIEKNQIRFQVQNPKPGKIKYRMDTISFYNKTGFKTDSFEIDKSELETYGDISGKMESDADQTIFIELLDHQQKLIAKSKGKDFLFHVKPGKYQIQAFVDWNGDGRYTGGNKDYFRKAEPFYKYETTVELKPGWDIEKLILQPGF